MNLEQPHAYVEIIVLIVFAIIEVVHIFSTRIIFLALISNVGQCDIVKGYRIEDGIQIRQANVESADFDSCCFQCKSAGCVGFTIDKDGCKRYSKIHKLVKDEEATTGLKGKFQENIFLYKIEQKSNFSSQSIIS